MHIMRQNANGMGAINHVTYVVVHRPASHAKRVHQRGINISSTYTAVHRPASHAKSFEATMQQQQQATGVSAVVPSRTVVGTGDGAFSSIAAQASVGVVAAQAHGVESDDLQQDLQPSPAAPVVEPMGHHGRSEEILLEEERRFGSPSSSSYRFGAYRRARATAACLGWRCCRAGSSYSAAVAGRSFRMKKKYRAKLQQLLLMLGCLLTGYRRPTWRAPASS
jgi:hypothetical protein